MLHKEIIACIDSSSIADHHGATFGDPEEATIEVGLVINDGMRRGYP